MAEIKFERVAIREDDSLTASDDFWETLAKARAEATRRGIEANAIVINQNMVHVPEQFGMWPEMICGLHCYFTDKELPEGYSFAVCRNPNQVEKPAQGFGEWISVEERLPDEFVSVLVCIPSENPLPTVKEAYLANGAWATKMAIFFMEEVTHWMPLPEPPKGGNVP